MNAFTKAFNAILDVFFPPLCIKCRAHLKGAEKAHLLCRSCFDSIPINRVIVRPDKNTVLFALGRYDDMRLRELIHCLKYDKFVGARNTIRALIKKYLSEVNVVGEVGRDAILIPIPLHPARLRERGFNQSQIIAEELSRLTGLKIDSNILHRVKNTKSQIELESYEKRRENLRDSFELNPAHANPASAGPRYGGGELTGYRAKTLILVDDVYTSGATMKEAMKILRKLNAKNIFYLVLAAA